MIKAGFRKKIYISLIVFAIFCFLLFLLVIYPLIKKIKEDSQQLLVEKENQLYFQEQRQSYNSFKEVYQEINPNLEKVNELFFDPDNPIIFISFLEDNASKANISLKISSISARRTEADSWPSLDFSLEAVGSYPEFLFFVKRLENAKYLIEIYDLQIRRLSGEGIVSGTSKKFSAGDVSADFTLKVFTK